MRQIVAQAVHPVILQVAQDQPLPGKFATRAELVESLKNQVRVARQIVGVQAEKKTRGVVFIWAEEELAWFEAELPAQSAILEVERRKET
jgi:hypothetical protein